MSEWHKFTHQLDPSVKYEARLVEDQYEVRYPGETNLVTVMNKQLWEAIYAPVESEEVTSG